jgi:hypothetical protein
MSYFAVHKYIQYRGAYVILPPQINIQVDT